MDLVVHGSIGGAAGGPVPPGLALRVRAHHGVRRHPRRRQEENLRGRERSGERPLEKDEEEGGGMNLYRVEVTKVIYVLAENKQEAEDDGPDHAEQESGYEEVFATEATDFVAIEKEWKDSIPY